MKTLLFLTFLTLTIISTNFQSSLLVVAQPNQNDTNFIKDSCTTTTYPPVCYSTLSGYSAQVNKSPKLLAITALVVAHKAAESASETMTRLSRIRGLRPNVAAPLLDCTIAVGHSEAQLERAIDEMGAHNEAAQMVVSDIQTWTSTALTYAGTCMDGFAGKETDGNVEIIVRRVITRLAQVTSNALALVNNYAIKRKSHQVFVPTFNV